MQLNHAQKSELFDRGYVKIPGVIPRVMVDEAVKAINHSIGNGIDPEQLSRFRAQSYCPELSREPVISDLFNGTPARLLAESAIGEIRPVGGGQIALRFPVAADPAPKARPHLDGMHSPTNGVPEGVIHNFTALMGVLLSDLPGPNAGNFTVWPGTHRIYEAYFKEHTPQSLLNGMPPVSLPEPEQITGQAGDVVLVHYQIGHGVTPNVSPHTRYAIFFRLKHVDHDDRKWESMTNIWLNWDGMQDIRKAKESES
ncbi:MAG TPA: hypothetical protein VFJ58_12385 [Armatimonadota bacterium]|nr:hypothetical protein [Armatimonadota bacterium]